MRKHFHHKPLEIQRGTRLPRLRPDLLFQSVLPTIYLFSIFCRWQPRPRSGKCCEISVLATTWCTPPPRLQDFTPKSLFRNILRITSLFPRFCGEQSGTSSQQVPRNQYFGDIKRKKREVPSAGAASAIKAAPPFAILEERDRCLTVSSASRSRASCPISLCRGTSFDPVAVSHSGGALRKCQASALAARYRVRSVSAIEIPAILSKADGARIRNTISKENLCTNAWHFLSPWSCS